LARQTLHDGGRVCGTMSYTVPAHKLPPSTIGLRL
jgi:hypothetical protein